MTIVRYVSGESASKPTVMGKPNGSKPEFVEATGLYMGLLKGRQAWVTGDGVQPGIARGSLVPLGFPIDSLRPPSKNVTIKVPTNEGIRPAETASMVAASAAGRVSRELVVDQEPVDFAEPVPVTAPAEPEAEAEAEVEVDEVESSTKYDPGDYPVSEVIAYIEEHPDEAAEILAREAADRNRKTLLREFAD